MTNSVRPDSSMRFDDYMAQMDALLWSIERDPMLRSGTAAVLLFDAGLSAEVFRTAVRACITQVPRLRQVVVQTAWSTAPPRFVDDPFFDLDYHTPVVAAPGDGSLEAVLKVAEHVRTRGLDRQRPLWELTLVTGMCDGKSAIILKIHHSVTDAVGGLQMIIAPLLTLEPGELAQPTDAVASPRGHGVVTLVGDATRYELRTAARSAGHVSRAGVALVRRPGALAGAVRTLASVAKTMKPVGAPLSELMTGRSLSAQYLHLEVPTDALRASAKAVGVKFNDAFVSGVVGGLALYHEQHGKPAPALRMLMPVSLRQQGGAAVAGNAFSAATIEVPAAIADIAERVLTVRDLSAQAQAEPGLRAFGPIAAIASRLPPAILTPLYKQMVGGIDFITSNVPGPPVPLYLGNAMLSGFLAYGPIGSAAVNVTVMTYNGTAYLAISCDRAAVPDPDVLLACLRKGFDEVLALADARAGR